ncbi:MAG: Flp pilus assembly complex ATPase component TadA, partial [Candidatus Omnitrophica bacterium]|nr:Flp pilus assembly complex ATPase component TadA [Candidatus Omnitrophota bacterium]
MSVARDRLAEILLDKGLLSEAQLAQALEVQRNSNKRLSSVLIKLGLVDEADLMLTLSEQLEVPPIRLERLTLDPDLAQVVPPEIAGQYLVVPVARLGDTLTVAMSDPQDIFALDDLRILTNMELRPLIATQRDIHSALERYYGESANEEMEAILKDLNREELEVIKDTHDEEMTLDAEALGALTEQGPIVRLTDMILADSIKRRASDIFIEPLANRLRVRFRIDGLLREVNSLPRNLHQSIVSRLKVMSELDIAEHRLPQDGRFKAGLDGRVVDFRINVLPTTQGEKAVLRILDKTQAMLDIAALGFQEHELNLLRKAAARPHGMILATGPTGAGKTT